MINMLPYSFHSIGKRILFSNDAGDFFLSSPKLLDRLINEKINPDDDEYLLRKGFAYQEKGDFFYNSHLSRLRHKKNINDKISYIIAVPTLRCDLSCDYCQVSRANLGAKGFDWSDDILQAFKKFIKETSGNKLKIEFQGGEPTLRLDIIEDVITFCEQEGIESEFIICTNLNTLSADLMKILEKENVYISTSIDGSSETHTRNRTKNENTTSSVLNNYKIIQNLYGPNKINALPTITTNRIEEIKDIIDYYISIGQTSIFLRPVNHQGFARKKFSSAKDEYEVWLKNYLSSVQYIFEHNYHNSNTIIEVGMEIALRRIFIPSYNGHVDLRSPNPAAKDYIVVNYDGDLYPSDEARMLSRIRHVNLKIGNILLGLDNEFLKNYNWNQINDTHEDCIHCAYKPFCGIDTVDDLSRKNRTDLPKNLTYFCNSSMSTFDFIFSKLNESDPVALFNIQGHLTGQFSLNPFSSDWIYD